MKPSASQRLPANISPRRLIGTAVDLQCSSRQCIRSRPPARESKSRPFHPSRARFATCVPRSRRASILSMDSDPEFCRIHRGARPMPNPFRHHETLPRSKINDLVFKIDQEMAVENEEEFVDVIMLVPVVFALQNAEPHDRVVHLTKSLVVPFVRARIDQLLNID